MANFKKLDLVKGKTLNFTKVNSLVMDLHIYRAKKIFIYVQKIFIQLLTFYHFNAKDYFQIETNVSGFTISRIFS